MRCKVTCTTNEGPTALRQGHLLSFSPVYVGSAENEAFFVATPTLSLNIYTVNDTAAAEAVVGQEYYLDITHAPVAVAPHVNPADEMAAANGGDGRDGNFAG